MIKQAKKDGRKMFNYSGSINPPVVCWLLVEECGEKFLIKLTPDATIFGLAPIWRQDNSPSSVGEFETARQIIMDEVEAIGGIAIDCIDFVPHESKYYADSNCLHPNDEGYGLYFQNLWPKLQAALKG